MAKILSSDTYTTPQPGRSVCVVKSYEVELKAADLVADNLINIGKPPEAGLGTSKVWRHLYSTISRVGTSGIDSGTGNRFDVGDVNDVTRVKQPRAIYVERAIESGSSLALENPDIALELGLDVLKSNPGRLTGRVAGGSLISFAGNKGTKGFLSKAGKSKKVQKAGGRAASALAFTTSQYGAAIRAVNGLIDDLEEAGADLSEISTGTIGRAAIAAAAGGEISYDALTGDIILLNPGVEGKVSGEILLGNLPRRE